MKKQYLAMAQSVFQEAENKWTNVKAFYAESFGEGRYYATEEEARRALTRYIAEHNREYQYGKDGTRTETTVCGMIGVDFVSRKEDDDKFRVVRWKIKVREVTDWEEVECG